MDEEERLSMELALLDQELTSKMHRPQHQMNFKQFQSLVVKSQQVEQWKPDIPVELLYDSSIFQSLPTNVPQLDQNFLQVLMQVNELETPQQQLQQMVKLLQQIQRSLDQLQQKVGSTNQDFASFNSYAADYLQKARGFEAALQVLPPPTPQADQTVELERQCAELDHNDMELEKLQQQVAAKKKQLEDLQLLKQGKIGYLTRQCSDLEQVALRLDVDIARVRALL